MSRLTDELAVQSWCYREFKTAKDLIAKVKETGLSRLELCGVHADFNKPETFDATIKPYTDAGVTIVSIGVETFNNDEAFMRQRFEFARKAGCKTISVHFKPDTFLATLPIAYKLCHEYDIKLAIHNHGGYHWLGNGEILEWVFSFTRCCIGLNMDTAWALDARQNPVEWAAKFAHRLYAVHLKDFVFDRARKSSDVVVGTGNLDLPALLKTLKANNFAGPPILEYEGDFNNPVPALKQCVQAITKADAAS
jgi:sugar phosphate isomerase/epimerase